MNIQDLETILRDENIREDAYDLSGGHRPETYTLRRGSGGEWFYYYSEKGQESDRRQFRTESDACEYILAKLRADPNTKA